MTHTRKFAVVAAALALSGLTACGVGPDKSREDAHDTKNVDKSAPHSIAFNNRFPNIEDKCDGSGHRVFVSTGGAVIVLPDPTCPGFIKGSEPAVVVTGR